MQFLLPSAVLILMLSVGMSLRFTDLIARWRVLTWASWSRLLLATSVAAPLRPLPVVCRSTRLIDSNHV